MDYELLRTKTLRYRAKHNLSQEAFANLVGVTKATIWNFESGKSKPTNLTQQKILIAIEEKED